MTRAFSHHIGASWPLTTSTRGTTNRPSICSGHDGQGSCQVVKGLTTRAEIRGFVRILLIPQPGTVAARYQMSGKSGGLHAQKGRSNFASPQVPDESAIAAPRKDGPADLQR